MLSPCPKKKYISERVEREMIINFNRALKNIKMKGSLINRGKNSQLKSKVEVSSFSLKGNKQTGNQDSVAWAEGIYIIADGHGTNGKLVSQFITNNALSTLHSMQNSCRKRLASTQSSKFRQTT